MPGTCACVRVRFALAGRIPCAATPNERNTLSPAAVTAVLGGRCGPETPALGEVKKPGQPHLNQAAATLAALPGVNYAVPGKTGKPVEQVLRKPGRQQGNSQEGGCYFRIEEKFNYRFISGGAFLKG